MSIEDDPVFPLPNATENDVLYFNTWGLSKLELFAGLALAGYLARGLSIGPDHPLEPSAVKWAVKAAEELCKELLHTSEPDESQ
ncbi:MAG: hypothetical protein ACREUT_17475 [Steroidobacteraceae bacterium]